MSCDSVLVLIENSLQISSVWLELSDYYLNPLIDSFGRALASLAVIESSVDANGIRHAPKPISLSPSLSLRVNFDFSSDARISPSRINDCIQHLDNTIYPIDVPPTLHLVIVAATPPSADCSGMSPNAPWKTLAEKLAQRSIHCHLILVSGEDFTPLTMLFELTLSLQNYVEEAPPFMIDHNRYRCRLSARPPYPSLGELEQNASTYAANALSTNSRRKSHPDSHFDGNPPPSSSVTAFTPPNAISLVSHLKWSQGLIKKKQHSKDPQPAPFIADARVQEPTTQSYTAIIPSSSPPSSGTSPSSASSSSPTSSSSLPSTSPSATSFSSIPLTSRHRKPQSLAISGFSNFSSERISPTTANGGRSMSLSRADRKQRLSQASSGSSPTDSVHAHMRRSSQAHIQNNNIVGDMNAPGQGGTWLSNSHALSQMHVQRSTPDLEMPMSSPTSAMNGSTTSNPGGRGVPLDVGMGAMPSEGDGSSLTLNGVGNHDMSPESVSSYVSSDMSSPTTPGSNEDLLSYARSQAFHHQGITYQITYQQQNEVVAGSQDGMWAHLRQQPPPHVQEMNFHEQLPQTLHDSHFYPEPSSNYFPIQPTQQYFHSQQQNGSMQPPIDPYLPGVSGVVRSDPVQDVQAQQQQQPSSIPSHLGGGSRQQQQALRRQSYNSYPHAGRPALKASPPPMIVPSQSHIPLTVVNQATTTTQSGGMEMVVNPATRSSPRPTPARIPGQQQQQQHGRARSSTIGSLSNLKNGLPSSKIAKSKRHKKSASSVSHSIYAQSTTNDNSSPQTPTDDSEVFEVSPLYAASTGLLFESTFNIKSGLLDGPSALANAEDISRVAPALGVGEGPNVYARLSMGTVDAAGGLYRSSLEERGGVMDDVSGTAVVAVPAGTFHASHQNQTSSKGSNEMNMSFGDVVVGNNAYPPFGSSANSYPYEGQQQVSYGRQN